MRKLVSIRTVRDITPIPNADKIELIHIDGWKVVAQKGLYNIGDDVVYFEVDSFLPIIPQFEWLRPSSYRKNDVMGEGFLIKTVKLRGQFSQGILMPVQEIVNMLCSPASEQPVTPEQIQWMKEQNLAELIGVKKWDPITNSPFYKQNVALGPFPHFIPKTDQERWQNLTEEIETYCSQLEKPIKFHTSEKLDGSSITVYYYAPDNHFGVCSRNLELKPEGKMWETVKRLDIERNLRSLGISVAMQGEFIGPGVQGNKYNLKENDIYFFDVYNIEEARYLSPNDMHVFLLAGGYKEVPQIDNWYSSLFEALPNLWEGEKEFRNSILNPSHEMEGYVFKSGDRSLSFKAINPYFLLKEKD